MMNKEHCRYLHNLTSFVFEHSPHIPINHISLIVTWGVWFLYFAFFISFNSDFLCLFSALHLVLDHYFVYNIFRLEYKADVWYEQHILWNQKNNALQFIKNKIFHRICSSHIFSFEIHYSCSFIMFNNESRKKCF